MSQRESLQPRVFMIRHGETEWSKSGRHTSFTEIDLLPEGREQVTAAARTFVGNGKLIDASRVSQVLVSPRKRARTTLELLLPSFEVDPEKITFTEDLTEWNYGLYEGLTKSETKKLVRDRGWDKDREWDVWSDGCEGGESLQQVSARLDKLIAKVKDIQKPHMQGTGPGDIVLVAHGLILRCFMKRWLKYKIDDRLPMTLAAGSIGILSYRNNSIDETSFHAGIAVPPYSP